MNIYCHEHLHKEVKLMFPKVDSKWTQLFIPSYI